MFFPYKCEPAFRSLRILLFHSVRYLGVSLLSILRHFFFLFVVAYNAFYCLINYCVRYFRQESDSSSSAANCFNCSGYFVLCCIHNVFLLYCECICEIFCHQEPVKLKENMLNFRKCILNSNRSEIMSNAFQSLECSTSCPGGDLIDGLHRVFSQMLCAHV